MRRFFLGDKVNIGQEAFIYGSDAKHIHRVLRMSVGDHLIIFDGAGNDFEAEIIKIDPGKATIKPLKKVRHVTDSPVSITIAQAMLKGKKMDVLARQITELGVKRWIPFLSERSVASPPEDRLVARLERWRTIALESLKQCQRSRVPEICHVESLKKVLDMGMSDDLKLLFWENETRTLKDVLGPCPRQHERIFVVLGPEGGFSQAEVEAAVSQGYQCVSLGPRILKAETATVAVCTLMQFLFGDLS